MTNQPDTTIGPTSRVYFSQRLRLHYVDWGNQIGRASCRERVYVLV